MFLKREPGARFLATLLLLGFLAHAGEGLVAALCHPEVEAHIVEIVHAPDHQDAYASGPEEGSAAHDHGDGTQTSDAGSCPFGSGSLAACSGSATVLSVLTASGPTPAAIESLVRPLSDDVAGALLALTQFRPPRG